MSKQRPYAIVITLDVCGDYTTFAFEKTLVPEYPDGPCLAKAEWYADDDPHFEFAGVARLEDGRAGILKKAEEIRDFARKTLKKQTCEIDRAFEDFQSAIQLFGGLG